MMLHKLLVESARQRVLSLAIVSAVLVGGLALIGAAAEEVSSGGAQSIAQASTPPTPNVNRCNVRNGPDGWWLLTPDGKPFFSLGVCMFNQGKEGNVYIPAKPYYVASRHYDTPEAWANASLARLRSWGFTTVGGWSDYDIVCRATDDAWWLTPVLHLGSTSGAPWFDMWDEKVIRRVEEVAARNMTPLRGERRVLGYYSDNELGWWNAILWKMTLEQPSTSGQRQRLVKLVREVYDNDWQKLSHDFEPENATNWEQLEQGGMLWLRPGSNGIHTVRRFLGLAGDRYYQLMRDTIRKFDLDAMYLGDRYQSFYYPEVAQAARPYVDVISTNLNASWNDGTFIRAYLDSLHGLTRKPVLVSEFYMSAAENQSGNRNKVGGFPIVATQAQRARALSNTLQSLARLPYVVGADWFQYYDEPPHGRSLDGEDYNFGLVDVYNVPYPEVTAAFASLDFVAIKRKAAISNIKAALFVPPAPTDPLSNFRSMLALKNWDRQRGFVPPRSPLPRGDLYACWSPQALYLAAYVIDIVEPDYYRAGEVPEEDRAQWTIRINGGEPLTVRLGSGKPPAASDSSLRIESLGGIYHDVRSIAAIELPVARLGMKLLGPGEKVTLDTTYTTHGSAYHMRWQADLTLAE